MAASMDDSNIMLKQPPLDSVLDGYYKVDETMNLTKLRAIKKVMKSAISITKSKTGEVILRTNRIEQANLKRKIDVVRKERTFAEVDINRNKIVFKAQYKKWMDYRKNVPGNIQGIKDRYKQVKYMIKQRQLIEGTASPEIHSKFGNAGFSSIIDASGLSRRQKSPQNRFPFSQPRRLVASRDSISSQSQRRRAEVDLWRENTFDMSSIRNMLTDQQLQQDSIYCKKRIDDWKKQVIERQKTINEHFRFTRTGEIAGNPRLSASTDTSLGSRMPTPAFHFGSQPPLPNITTQTMDKSKTFMHPTNSRNDDDDQSILKTRASYGGAEIKKGYHHKGLHKNKASKLSSSLNLKGKSVSFDT